MPEKPSGVSDDIRLNEEAARRLIQRATELDATRAAESSVAELREAARGAGISDEAFQRALEEVRGGQSESAQKSQEQTVMVPRRRYLAFAAAAMLLGAILLLFFMVVIPSRIAVPVDGQAAPAAPVPDGIRSLPPPGTLPSTPTKLPPRTKTSPPDVVPPEG